MAAPTKRSAKSDIPDPDHPPLLDEILDHMIVPLLPFKALKCFQCVSQKYRSLIGHDPLFPSEQARLMSHSPTDLVHTLGNGRLTVLINPQSVGVPDPSLQFLSSSPNYVLRLLCSTNGLLLYFGKFEDSERQLCVCNPATQEKVFVPSYQHMLFDPGLAFDPTIAPNRFMLVYPQPEFANDGCAYAYSFVIFRFDTGGWSRSNKKVHVTETFDFQKSVHTQGVTYWRCSEYIIWYNTEKDSAGLVPLPTAQGSWWMGVYAGTVVCCHTRHRGVEVWRLTNGTSLDRLYCIGWDNLPLQLSNAWKKSKDRRHTTGHLKSQQFQPLAFDGQFIYLLNFPEPGVWAEVLGYNICTRQLEKKSGKLFIRFMNEHGVHNYHNSMVPLPKFLD